MGGIFLVIKGGTGNPTKKPVLLKQKIEFNIMNFRKLNDKFNTEIKDIMNLKRSLQKCLIHENFAISYYFQ